MESYKSGPNILRIFGISKSDYVSIEDTAEIKYRERLENEEQIDIKEVIFDKIPTIFENLKTWPMQTNLLCWHCDLKFDSLPIFVPTYAKHRDSGLIEFGVRGNFCSFNCAEAWILINYAEKDHRWSLQNLLCMLYFIFTGQHVVKISPSPSKTLMNYYGGDLTVEAYKEQIKKLKPIMLAALSKKTVKSPQITIWDTIRQNCIDTDEDKFDEATNIDKLKNVDKLDKVEKVKKDMIDIFNLQDSEFDKLKSNCTNLEHKLDNTKEEEKEEEYDHTREAYDQIMAAFELN